MLRIKILGIGCARHKKLKANIAEALRQYPVHANIREVSEVNDLIRYGISSTPALVINNEVWYENEVPSVDALVSLFKKLQPKMHPPEYSKTILVPIDFSDASTDAFHYALDLASYFDAKIKVVHVYHPEFDLSNPYIPEPVAGFVEAREKQLNLFLKENLESHQKKEANIAVQPIVEGTILPGFASQELPHIIKIEKPILVVMGTTGSNNLGVQLFGSVSKDVSQNSDYPVLLVPGGEKFHGIKKILYASNYYLDDEVLVNRVMEIGKKFAAEFHIVHVEQKVNGYLFTDEDFKKVFTKHGGPCKYKFKRIKDNQVAETLSRYVEEEEIDMVVMLTQNRSFWQNLLHRSVTRRMALITSVPLMIIHLDM